jgi:hypothetical protein
MRSPVRLLSVVAAVVAAVSSMTASGAGPAAAAGCESWSGEQPSGASAAGVAIVSACQVWLVGSDIEEWNGSAWRSKPVPEPAGSTGIGFDGVAAPTASTAWAVGYAVIGGVFRTLIEHWNGHAWSIQPSKNVGPENNGLNGVAATSGTNAWAVGNYSSGGVQQPLMEHWIGTSWKRVTLPALPTGATGGDLTAVTATSTTNAWAAGVYRVGSRAMSLILHWNGSSWKRQPSPNPGGTGTNASTFIWGISGTSATTAWAVGTWYDGQHAIDRTLVLRWTGSAWITQPSPSTSDPYNNLSGVTVTSASNAWAVGSHLSNNGPSHYHPLIEHWDGSHWSVVTPPNPGGASADNQLLGVAAQPGVGAWAVGWHLLPPDPEVALAIHCC